MKVNTTASPPVEFDANDCWFRNEKGECTISHTECIPQSYCYPGVEIKEFIGRLDKTLDLKERF